MFVIKIRDILKVDWLISYTCPIFTYFNFREIKLVLSTKLRIFSVTAGWPQSMKNPSSHYIWDNTLMFMGNLRLKKFMKNYINKVTFLTWLYIL